jgi:CheY-like chemotaxis protein
MAKILVVDDSKFSRVRAAQVLRGAGHDVFEASDGAAGLEGVAAHDPDCVLLDMLMPVLDGLEFLTRLRAGGSRLPVIVLTADIQQSTRELCANLGVSGFLQKPALGEDICRSVEEALAFKRGGVACG